jgi:hypothetical protein
MLSYLMCVLLKITIQVMVLICTSFPGLWSWQKLIWWFLDFTYLNSFAAVGVVQYIYQDLQFMVFTDYYVSGLSLWLWHLGWPASLRCHGCRASKKGLLCPGCNIRLTSFDGFSFSVLNFFPLTMCLPVITQILRPN